VGYTEVDDALHRLDKATQKEALTMAAQALDVAHCVHDELIHVASEVKGVRDTVKDVVDRIKGLEEGKTSSLLDVLDSAQPNSSSL
jgi:hypothetical protein